MKVINVYNKKMMKQKIEDLEETSEKSKKEEQGKDVNSPDKYDVLESRCC